MESCRGFGGGLICSLIARWTFSLFRSVFRNDWFGGGCVLEHGGVSVSVLLRRMRSLVFDRVRAVTRDDSMRTNGSVFTSRYGSASVHDVGGKLAVTSGLTHSDGGKGCVLAGWTRWALGTMEDVRVLTFGGWSGDGVDRTVISSDGTDVVVYSSRRLSISRAWFCLILPIKIRASYILLYRASYDN